MLATAPTTPIAITMFLVFTESLLFLCCYFKRSLYPPLLVLGLLVTQLEADDTVVNGDLNTIGDDNIVVQPDGTLITITQNITMIDGELGTARQRISEIELELQSQGGRVAELASELAILREREAQLVSEKQSMTLVLAEYQSLTRTLQESRILIPETESNSRALQIARDIGMSSDSLAQGKALLERLQDETVLDQVLHMLIDNTPSMGTEREKNEWRSLVTVMNFGQKMRLLGILGEERVKLNALLASALEKIRELNTKNLSAALDFDATRDISSMSQEEKVSYIRVLLSSGTTVDLRAAEVIVFALLTESGPSAELLLLLAEIDDAKDVREPYKIIDTYGQNSQIVDRNANLLLYLGVAHMRVEHYEVAHQIFQNALLVGGDQDRLLENYAMLSARYGNPDLAVQLLEKPIERRGLKNLDPDTTVAIARLLNRADRFEDSKALVSEYLETDFVVINYARSPELLFEDDAIDSRSIAKLYDSLGWSNYYLNDYGMAVEGFQSAIYYNSNSMNSHTMAALSMLETGADNYDEMEALLDTALALAPISSGDEKDMGEIALAIALIKLRSGQLAGLPQMAALATAQTYGCSATYLSEQRNWHKKALDLLNEYRQRVGCP